MTKINVIPLNLKDLGNKLKVLSENYDEKMLEIDKVFKEIDSLLLWSGEDEDSYMSKISERYMETLKKIGVELADYSDYLIKTSNAYSTIEEYFNEREVEI